MHLGDDQEVGGDAIEDEAYVHDLLLLFIVSLKHTVISSSIALFIALLLSI